MKRVLRGLALLAVVGTAGASTAQAQGELMIGGGSSIPTGDFGEGFKNGPHGVLAFGFVVPRIPVGFRLQGMFHRISGEEVGTVEGPDLQVISGTGDLVFKVNPSPDAKFRPYVFAGAGLYNTKLTGDEAPEGVSGETDFGYGGGVGLDIGSATGLGFFVEGRYHSIDTEGESANVITASAGARIALGNAGGTGY